MIKRPLDKRFRDAVLNDIKTTTIRNKPWPVGVPIMLYHWSGAPYRSKQIDVAAVVVSEVRHIKITHKPDGDMLYAYGHDGAWVRFRIHQTEGFTSRDEMDNWFRPLIKPGQTVSKSLMMFKRAPSFIISEPAL